MQIYSKILIILSLAFLVSCSQSYKNLQNSSLKPSDQLSEYLLVAYKEKADFEAQKMHDWNSAKLYSEKALNAAQAATQEIQQAARAAQEAAGDVVAGISGSDLEALRQLPNDALGVWTLVGPDGKPVASGKHKGIVCNISSCGAGAAWAAEEHAKGNSYVRTNRTDGY